MRVQSNFVSCQQRVERAREKCGLALALSAALCVLLAGEPASAKATFVTFDVEGHDTVVTGINSTNTVTGSYYVDGYSNGFVRSADGAITAFDSPRGCALESQSINDGGATTGSCSGGLLGFVRTADGVVTTFDIPNHGVLAIWPRAINNKGDIAGYCITGSAGNLGFVRAADGKITTFTIPDEGLDFVSGIDDKGEVVGTYVDYNLNRHGFLRARGGIVTTVDPPGASSAAVTTINAKGTIAGAYSTDAGGGDFVRAPDGTITTFDALPCYALPVGVNRKGVLAARYCYEGNSKHTVGFVRRQNGTILLFHVPDSKATDPAGVSDAGVIAGTYRPRGTHSYRGFLRFQ